ncbi:hypothetical protein [Metabacillus sediminilitoris]|uniref:hypothetical protein n=1 Tax=Metabacillus sediminilitoris TaxID=2567941 RepID=UPI0012D7C24E|nr:hypothetical protein [Metabacillus sediminilitoris]QGQ45383.1 hypothetical protein GMB29_09005 [Metabacillus sediminilitoris]
MGLFFELLGSIGTFLLPFLKEVSEEEIEKNITLLKRYQWFMTQLENEKHKNLIYNDIDVRYIIGKLNPKKMEKKSYNNKYQFKINKILQKKKQSRLLIVLNKNTSQKSTNLITTSFRKQPFKK